VSIYDPRHDVYLEETKNPVLILADILIKSGFYDNCKGHFWSQIAYLANHVNGNGYKRKRIKRIKIKTITKQKLNAKRLKRKRILDEKKALVRQRILSVKKT